MKEVVREFLIETHENLAQLDLDLVSLERDPTERETLGRAFRTLHTIKGTAGFLGLQKLQAVAHAAENLLSRLRDGKLVFNGDIANGLLAGVDAVRHMLETVETDETDGEVEFSEVIRSLDQLCAARGSTGSSVVVLLEQPFAQTKIDLGQLPRFPPTAPFPASLSGIDSLPRSPSSPSDSAIADAADARASGVSDSSIRVDVGLLDTLMNLVGELVLARNQIVQYGTSQENAAFLGTVQRLNMLTTELQAGVMKTRMQPIGNIWNKFPRVVRDLALACGKQARIDMDGQDTELDKTIIEAIRDPLTHLVRNAIDHGIESPTERAALGKPAEGRLALRAFHEGGKVIIEITDDGAGIDPRRVRTKAIQAKLLAPEHADRLTERELMNLVFLPGFSTSDQVTQFSGRGVGMDVVRINVEKIGGTVMIDSRPGRGTTVKMKIPLTLAIIPALTITCGGDRYAIPQGSLLELVRLEGENAQRGIEFIHGAPVYRLRGNLLPLVYLDRILGCGAPSRDKEAEGPAPTGEINIVVLQADDRHFGLVVDGIHDTEEIVVKPLHHQLKGIGAFTGATIMGDGKVALILDVLGLAQKANVVSEVRERALIEAENGAAKTSEDRQTVLLFATRDGGRMAIPLALVARLEEFPRASLEKAGAQDVVQYRGDILPLIHVSRALRRRNSRGPGQGLDRRLAARRRAARPSASRSETIQVVVHAAAGRLVGMVVDHILDIAEETIVSRSPAQRPGVLFSAVVQGRVTEFLDVEEIIRSAYTDLAGPAMISVEG